MTTLVTGAAGFIGSHLVDTLLARGERVIGLDSFVPYYNPQRKRRNLAAALQHPQFRLVELDIREYEAVEALIEQERPTAVAHLAAMPGPRPSIQDPAHYAWVNVGATYNLLDQARKYGVERFMLASTSSVYGRAEVPFREDARTDQPLSPYAATKKAAEVAAYTFHALYGLPISIARFFTVYGPRGRPDMTPYLFVDRMVRGEPITLFNGGRGLFRDYTYVDDIISGVTAALDRAEGCEIYNLGNSQPVELRRFVELLETITGLPALIDEQPLPATEPPITFADTSKAAARLGFASQTVVEDGLERFWHWYRQEILQRGEG